MTHCSVAVTFILGILLLPDFLQEGNWQINGAVYLTVMIHI